MAERRTPLGPSPVRTEVFDRVSPPEVVERKRAELAALGPSGWTKLLFYRLVSLPVWMGAAASLLYNWATRPAALFASPNPRRFELVPPFPLHEEFIEVNGIKLHAVSPGRRPGKPLVLMLHGFPELWYSWRHQMAALHEAGGWDVVALDMRGYNLSDKPQGVDAYRSAQLASDVRAAVAALGHEACTLVAHDWGGSVAWVAAGLYGRGLVERLVVMGLPHWGVGLTNFSSAQAQKSMYILMLQARGLAELVLTVDDAAPLHDAFLGGPMALCNRTAMDEHDVDWFRSALCQPGAATATLEYYRALLQFVTMSDPADPVWGALKRQLDMPVLVLHGASDGALGEELLDGIEAAVPDVTVKVLKNCSHWVQQDYPAQVNEILIEWLDAHKSTPATKQQQQQRRQAAAEEPDGAR